ncbi:hypothetical protein HW532_14075 [Kaustia mangrovi]|uniref:Uncharacterized protein n=1 Tax=Kaustia mangrovi TaxID=2593653 RepID=A0A7S8C5I5_9HYPH|nr:hypothetical protein [Kaustia mangrovi]QPC43716.1 hypothetical protein HW532_14075 [Kaustia mangrovi]
MTRSARGHTGSPARRLRRALILLLAGAWLSAAALPAAAADTSPATVAGSHAAAAAQPAETDRADAARKMLSQSQARAQALAVRDDPRVAFAMLLSLFGVAAALTGVFWRQSGTGRRKEDDASGDRPERHLGE